MCHEDMKDSDTEIYLFEFSKDKNKQNGVDIGVTEKNQVLFCA